MPKFYLVFLLLVLSAQAFADQRTPAEVRAVPDAVSSGVQGASIYLLGVNPQVFSQSSAKAPTVELPADLTLDSFSTLAPKRALLKIDVNSDAIGVYQCSLKFYSADGSAVVKTCVFYLSALGPHSASGFKLTLITVSEIKIDSSTLQRAGTFELEGALAGNVKVSAPQGVKFSPALKPQISSLSIGAEVSNIEVSETGESFTFFVDNPRKEVVRIFFSTLFLDTSGFSADGGQEGEIAITLENQNLPNGSLAVPVAHTEGYTIAADVASSSGSSSNNSNNNGYTPNGSTNPTNNNNNNSRDNSNSDIGNNPTNRAQPKVQDKKSPRNWQNLRSDYKQRLKNKSKRDYNRWRPRYIPRRRYPYRRNHWRSPRNDSRNSHSRTPSSKSDSSESEADKLANSAEITVQKGVKINILGISFCDANYKPTLTVPLKATDKGFVANLNVEIIFVDNSDVPKEITVTVALPGNAPIKVVLEKTGAGVYRSKKLLEIVVPVN